MVDLDELSKNYKIFVDTCSLMHCGSSIFSENLSIHLSKNNTKIIVPSKVIEELEKKVYDSDGQKKNDANRGLSIIQGYTKNKLVDIRGEKNDPFADNLFLTLFTKFRINHNLCLITQDKGLAEDIYKLKDSKSVKTKKEIKVLFIKEDGCVDDWENQLPNEIENIKKFQLYGAPIQEKDVLVNASILPSIQDPVFSDKYGKLHLINEIGNGGEGRIYLTDKGLVCKIYFREKSTLLKLNKLKLMLNNSITSDGVCWPKDLIFNSNNEFIGYIMDKGVGKPMQTAMYVKPVLQKNFPQWTRKDLVNISINILEKINYLHQRNVIIGDINPLNILIDNDKNILNIYFVDTDSYQIENYPCPVGTVNHTPPEIQGKDYKTFLRTFEQEYFAVATLLFMILLPGKPPYSQQGGSDPAHNIRSRDFPYPFGEQSSKKAPYGPWKFIWSNLPFYLKSAFYDIFKNDKRKPTKEWLDLMNRYLSDLEKKFVSDELFPTKYKLVNPIKINCSRCHNEVSDNKDWIEQLKSQGKDYVCEKCRKRKRTIIASRKEERSNICLGIIFEKILPDLEERKMVRFVLKQLERDVIIKVVLEKNFTTQKLTELIFKNSDLDEYDIHDAIEMGLNDGRIKFIQ